MHAIITFEDNDLSHVTMQTEVDTVGDSPTPSVVLALAVKALFENGMLARMGQIALEGIANNEDPADFLKNRYVEKNDTN